MKRPSLIALLSASAILGVVLGCGDGQTTGADTTPAIDTTTIDTTNPQGKVARLTEQLKYGPKNWQLWKRRSEANYDAGNIPAAISDIERAIQYSVTEPETYYLRGFYQYALKNDSAALRDFQRAADLNSVNPENYHQIGNIYLFREEWAKAEEAYDYAIKLDSMQPTYYLAKGLLRERQGKVDEAIRWYDLSIQRDPSFIKGLLALHDVFLSKKHNPDQAYVFNERVMLIDSMQPLAHYNQGNFLFTRANVMTDSKKVVDYEVLLKIALSEYNLCLKYDPTFVKALYARGYTYFLLEKYGQAIGDFNKVVELDPFNRDAFYMRGTIQEFQGDLTSALENYRRASEIDPKFRDAAVAVKELSQKVERKKTGGN